MVNRVILLGNLGKDPEVRRLENGAVVATFSIATNETYKDREGQQQTQTEWHNVVVWRHLAEIAEKYLKKGKLIYLEGKLTTRKWQDKDGNNRYTTEVVANNFRMMPNTGGSPYPGPSAQDEPARTSYGSNSSNAAATTATTTTATTEAPVTANNDANEAAGDDLPF